MNKKTEIYQLMPHSGILMQGYLIKTPNNKLVVIDGGNLSYLEQAFLPSFARAVLGLNEGDYFEIEAWFISHAHSDHYGELSVMLRDYDEKSNYKINNFYFDFPDLEKSGFDEGDYDLNLLQGLKNGLNTYAKVNGIACGDSYYDDLNGKFINAEAVKNGLTFTVDGVRFEILQTWDKDDDMVNGNSLVIKVWPENPDEKNCLFLNDTSIGSGARLLKTYGEKLKSDIVQMSHHGQAGADKDVYDMIDAKIRLWPAPFWLWDDLDKRYQIREVRSWVGVDYDNVTESDVVACLYKAYPEDYKSVDSWKKCVDGMKVVL